LRNCCVWLVDARTCKL